MLSIPQATYGKRQVGLCCPACDRGQRASARVGLRSHHVPACDQGQRASARVGLRSHVPACDQGQRASARVGLRSHVLQAPVSKLKICGASWRTVRVLYYEQKLLLSLKAWSSWRSMVRGVTQRMGHMLRILMVLASNYI